MGYLFSNFLSLLIATENTESTMYNVVVQLLVLDIKCLYNVMLGEIWTQEIP